MCGEFNLIYSQRFRSRGQRLCIFIGTKESVFIRKEFNSHRIGLGHQHGRRFIVLENVTSCGNTVFFARCRKWKGSFHNFGRKREKKVYSIQVGTFDNKNPEVDTL